MSIETITLLSGDCIITVPARRSPEESVELRLDPDIPIDLEVARIAEHYAFRERSARSVVTIPGVTQEHRWSPARRRVIVAGD